MSRNQPTLTRQSGQLRLSSRPSTTAGEGRSTDAPELDRKVVADVVIVPVVLPQRVERLDALGALGRPARLGRERRRVRVLLVPVCVQGGAVERDWRQGVTMARARRGTSGEGGGGEAEEGQRAHLERLRARRDAPSAGNSSNSSSCTQAQVPISLPSCEESGHGRGR